MLPCLKCRDEYPEYYLTDGVCEDCRLERATLYGNGRPKAHCRTPPPISDWLRIYGKRQKR